MLELESVVCYYVGYQAALIVTVEPVMSKETHKPEKDERRWLSGGPGVFAGCCFEYKMKTLLF